MGGMLLSLPCPSPLRQRSPAAAHGPAHLHRRLPVLGRPAPALPGMVWGRGWRVHTRAWRPKPPPPFLQPLSLGQVWLGVAASIPCPGLWVPAQGPMSPRVPGAGSPHPCLGDTHLHPSVTLCPLGGVSPQVACTVGRAEVPVRHGSLLPLGLDSSLRQWGLADAAQRQALAGRLREAAEASMAAVLAAEGELSPAQRGGARAHTDILGEL